MSISFDLPQDVHQQLQLVLGDVGQAANESLAIQGYSQRQFGISTLKGLLGLETKWQAE